MTMTRGGTWTWASVRAASAPEYTQPACGHMTAAARRSPAGAVANIRAISSATLAAEPG